MITRDDGRVMLAHEPGDVFIRETLLIEARQPSIEPRLAVVSISESERVRIAEREGAERVREVGLSLHHEPKQFIRQCVVAVFSDVEPDFMGKPSEVRGFIRFRVVVQQLVGDIDGRLLRVSEERQQRFDKAGQVPRPDIRLVHIGVASLAVDSS